MSRIGSVLAAVSACILTGCAPDFDGTWLFQWNLSSVLSISAEACDDVEDTTEYRGDRHEWIDIYSTTGGALVLTNGEREWVGTTSGSSFSVEATYGESDGSSYFQWKEEISGDLEGEDLSGASDYLEVECDAADGCEGQTNECQRQTRRRYVAVRMEGTDGAVRTIGTQSSQSASTN